MVIGRNESSFNRVCLPCVVFVRLQSKVSVQTTLLQLPCLLCGEPAVSKTRRFPGSPPATPIAGRSRRSAPVAYSSPLVSLWCWTLVDNLNPALHFTSG